MRYASLLIAALLPLGCATQSEMFRPGERTTATSPAGMTAAAYEIRGGRGITGEVKLWSDGAEQRDGATVVHVAFEIENLSDEPMRFETDQLRLESATLADGVLQAVEPVALEGSRLIAPGRAGTVGVLFALPSDVSPSDVEAFRVFWSVTGATDYAQITPFYEDQLQERLASGPYYWDTPFFDPFFYEPFRWSATAPATAGPTFY